MNLITILIDSLNRHCIGPYGNRFVKTPNLDRFAQKAAVFDSHFVGSLPCMPARRELMSGRKEFFWRGWGPLEPFDKPIAIEAEKLGAATAIVTDHYHYWEYAAHGYLEHFNSVKMIRGHELNMYNTEPLDRIPAWAQAMIKWRSKQGEIYYNNVKDFKSEEDFFSPRTLCEASDWLEKNHTHKKFFLWTECFDIHEPFHVPEPYRSMYTDKLSDDFTVWPPYQDGYHGHTQNFWQNVSKDEIEFIRGQYYGKITMTDKWLGKLFGVMDKNNLWDNTAVIITADHGHELGEKQRFGKQPPHYDLHANIPLMIWIPGMTNQKRINAFTTAVDLYPTMLGLLGEKNPVAPHGRSLLPLINGVTDKHREAVVYGTYAAGATVTNKNYTYHSTWDPQSEINKYSAIMFRPSPEAVSGKFIPGVDCPVWKIPDRNQAPVPELLFDRKNDTLQEHDISRTDRKAVNEMRGILKKLMDDEGVPPEQYKRLGF
ncbi:MAG: sulfatase [Treponema sp.]|nr:sulfatase [Treponema sp.]